jgi:uncharacterized protein with ParB-like and HNH nuclease domain
MAFIEAKEFKMRALLSNTQEGYKVPIYQRPYAWDKEQWTELFDDLKGLDPEDIHFLGSFVVVPEGAHKKDINYFELVDGQQRLTTLLIWLSAIRDLAHENGEESFVKHINNNFLFAEKFREGEEFKIPKIRLGNLDNDAFLRVLENKKKDYPHLIFDCYNFFKEKTDLNNWDWELLLDNISIVHINAFDYFNAFRLFETLNDRGLALSAADLIKNFILMKISKNDEGTNLDEIFNEVITEWNEMYEKIRDLEPVTFIKRYMQSQYKGKISESKLYEELKKKLETKNEKEILNFVIDLNSKASFYQKINNASFQNTKINKVLRKLHLIQVAPSYTLLLKVFPMFEEGKLSVHEIIEIMEMIETFHIRWGVCGKSNSRLDQIYNEMCVGLSKITKKEEYIDYIRDSFSKEIFKSTDDETFKRYFTSKKFNASDKRTKYIIWKLSDPTGETVFDINEIQTEHIMPKSLSKDWIAYLKRNSSRSEEEIRSIHEDKLDLIGNLTILKGEWNQRLSNRLFNNKIKDYSRSEFSQNKEIAKYSQWKFNQIDERTKLLAEKALKNWAWDQSYSSKFDLTDYWIASIKYDMAENVITNLLKKENKYALGSRTGGNVSVKPQDRICFYVSKIGIIADAEVNSFVKKDKIKGFESFINVFEIKNLNIFEKPIKLDEDIRKKLDAFETSSLKNWGWFVTNCHTITEHDFKILTT